MYISKLTVLLTVTVSVEETEVTYVLCLCNYGQMYAMMYSLMLISRSVLYIKLRYSAVIACEEINNDDDEMNQN